MSGNRVRGLEPNVCRRLARPKVCNGADERGRWTAFGSRQRFEHPGVATLPENQYLSPYVVVVRRLPNIVLVRISRFFSKQSCTVTKNQHTVRLQASFFFLLKRIYLQSIHITGITSKSDC